VCHTVEDQPKFCLSEIGCDHHHRVVDCQESSLGWFKLPETSGMQLVSLRWRSRHSRADWASAPACQSLFIGPTLKDRHQCAERNLVSRQGRRRSMIASDSLSILTETSTAGTRIVSPAHRPSSSVEGP